MISVMGFGEGGMMALCALAQMPDIAKGIVMSQRGKKFSRPQHETIFGNPRSANVPCAGSDH
jgi:predicted esterase